MISLMINDKNSYLKSIDLKDEDYLNFYKSIVEKFKEHEIENNINQLKEMDNFIRVSFVPIKRNTKTAASIMSEIYYSHTVKDELLRYVKRTC